jgi:hypothetical protein
MPGDGPRPSALKLKHHAGGSTDPGFRTATIGYGSTGDRAIARGLMLDLIRNKCGIENLLVSEGTLGRED